MRHTLKTRCVAPFVAALAIVTLLAGSAAADFQFFYGGHTYLTVTTPQSWADAASDAVGRQFAGVNGELARVDDQAENEAIFNALVANIPSGDFSETVAPDGGGGAFVWLGGTDQEVEGQWRWDGDGDLDGDVFWLGDETGGAAGGLYSNWGTTAGQNEPDNFVFQGMDQDAAGISLNGWPLGVARQWNDVRLANALYYVVEFNAVPEPASVGLLAAGLLAAALRRWKR